MSDDLLAFILDGLDDDDATLHTNNGGAGLEIHAVPQPRDPLAASAITAVTTSPDSVQSGMSAGGISSTHNRPAALPTVHKRVDTPNPITNAGIVKFQAQQENERKRKLKMYDEMLRGGMIPEAAHRLMVEELYSSKPKENKPENASDTYIAGPEMPTHCAKLLVLPSYCKYLRAFYGTAELTSSASSTKPMSSAMKNAVVTSDSLIDHFLELIRRLFDLEPARDTKMHMMQQAQAACESVLKAIDGEFSKRLPYREGSSRLSPAVPIDISSSINVDSSRYAIQHHLEVGRTEKLAQHYRTRAAALKNARQTLTPGRDHPRRSFSDDHEKEYKQVCRSLRRDPCCAFGGRHTAIAHSLMLHAVDGFVSVQRAVDYLACNPDVLLAQTIGLGCGYGLLGSTKVPPPPSIRLTVGSSTYSDVSAAATQPAYGYPAEIAGGIYWQPEAVVKRFGWADATLMASQALCLGSEYEKAEKVALHTPESGQVSYLPIEKLLSLLCHLIPAKTLKACGFAHAEELFHDDITHKFTVQEAAYVLALLCKILSRSVARHATSLSTSPLTDDQELTPDYLYATQDLMSICTLCLVLLCDPDVCGAVSHGVGASNTTIKTVDGLPPVNASAAMNPSAYEGPIAASAVLDLLKTVCDVLDWRDVLESADIEETEFSSAADSSSGYDIAIARDKANAPDKQQTAREWCVTVANRLMKNLFPEFFDPASSDDMELPSSSDPKFHPPMQHPHARLGVLQRLSDDWLKWINCTAYRRIRAYVARWCLEDTSPSLLPDLVTYYVKSDSVSSLGRLGRRVVHVGLNTAILLGENAYSESAGDQPTTSHTSRPTAALGASSTPPRPLTAAADDNTPVRRPSVVMQSASRLPRSRSRTHTNGEDDDEMADNPAARTTEFTTPTAEDLLNPHPLCEKTVSQLAEMITPFPKTLQSADSGENTAIWRRVIHHQRTSSIVSMLNVLVTLLWAPAAPMPAQKQRFPLLIPPKLEPQPAWIKRIWDILDKWADKLRDPDLATRQLAERVRVLQELLKVFLPPEDAEDGV